MTTWIEELVAANEVYIAERKAANVHSRAGTGQSRGIRRDQVQARAKRNHRKRVAALGIRPY